MTDKEMAIANRSVQPQFYEARARHQQGDLANAAAFYQEVLRSQPDHSDALHLLGVIAVQAGQLDRGIALIRKAITSNAGIATAHNNLGQALVAAGLHHEALGCYDQAIAIEPRYVTAHFNRANALLYLKRLVEALDAFDRVIALDPDHADAHYNCGNVLRELDRFGEAIVAYDRAIALNSPRQSFIYNNRGMALLALKRADDALASYETAITLKPDNAEAHWNKSLCLLLMGRLDEGFREYEWRKKGDAPIGLRSYTQPLWLGEQDIAGKTLFVYWEQGLGDTIQFCRYAKLAQARGARIVLSVQDPLHDLLKQNHPTLQVVRQSEFPVTFDYHCPLMSLPLALGTTLETIPAERQYLKANEELRAAWADKLPPRTKPRIGFAWSGRASHVNDRNRSIALEALLPILRSDADWICLQKEASEKDLAILRQADIGYFGDRLRDFSDTAALIELMDLIITVDTSVAHLAGAMGKPVWILLPFVPDWRWLLDRNDSPWYPSARLFRQHQMGDWPSVIEQVRRELTERQLAG